MCCVHAIVAARHHHRSFAAPSLTYCSRQSGKSALIIAKEKGNMEVVEILNYFQRSKVMEKYKQLFSRGSVQGDE
jgi:hypothetical protein